MIVGGGSDTVTERLTGTIIIIGFVYCGTVPSIIMVKEDGVMIRRGTQ